MQAQVEELTLQIEQAEAEIETLQGGGKKKHRGGAAAERTENLERLNDRRKWHINRLELIMRLLDNGTLTVEDANALKEDVKYFVESNAVRINTLDEQFAFSQGRFRKRTSRRTRVYTKNSTLMRRRRSSVWLTMRSRTSRRRLVKVRDNDL